MAYSMGKKLPKKTWDQEGFDPKQEDKKLLIILFCLVLFVILLSIGMFWIKTHVLKR